MLCFALRVYVRNNVYSAALLDGKMFACTWKLYTNILWKKKSSNCGVFARALYAAAFGLHMYRRAPHWIDIRPNWTQSVLSYHPTATVKRR